LEARESIAALGILGDDPSVAAMLAASKHKVFDVPARSWLRDHRDLARAALARTAQTRSRIGDIAVTLLREDVAAGNRAAVEALASPELASILFADERPIDMAWLDAPSAAKMPPWIYAEALPPLDLGDREVGEAQVPVLLDVFRKSSLAAPDPRATMLSSRARPNSADRFALALLRQWLRVGADPAERFVLTVVGVLGGDACVAELGPLIRSWPGQLQHARAVTGLDVLRSIGSDGALMQIADLARRVPYAALKKRAERCIDEIASAKRLTRERLEDRLAPSFDCPSSREREVLADVPDFVVRVDDGLVPRLSDGSGRILRDVPEPGEARSASRALKAALKTFAVIQRSRLEAAMTVGRRWFADEFRAFVVDHPLVGILARCLVRRCEPLDGAPFTFAVDSDGFVDPTGTPVEVPSTAAVGIAHRLHIAPDEVAAWQRFFGRRALPFSQLDRVTFAPLDVERGETRIVRFDGIAVAEATSLRRLRDRGWQRGAVEDGGMFGEHARAFAAGRILAVLEHDGLLIGSRDGDATVSARGCTFVAREDGRRGASLSLTDVDAIAVSEVFADLTFIFG